MLMCLIGRDDLLMKIKMFLLCYEMMLTRCQKCHKMSICFTPTLNKKLCVAVTVWIFLCELLYSSAHCVDVCMSTWCFSSFSYCRLIRAYTKQTEDVKQKEVKRENRMNEQLQMNNEKDDR